MGMNMPLSTVVIASLLPQILLPNANAAGQPMTARDLIEVCDISGMSLSPDGRTLVVRAEQPDVATNVVRLTWYAIPLPSELDAKPMVIADGGQPIWNAPSLVTPEKVQWSTDSTWMYYRALHGEEVQIWRARRDGSKAEQVTSDSADVQDYLLDEKGERLFYSVGASREEIKRIEREQYEHGIVIDPTVAVDESLLNNWQYHGRMTTLRRNLSHDLFVVAGPGIVSVRTIDLDTRILRETTETEQQEFTKLLASRSDHFAPCPASLCKENRLSPVSGRLSGSEHPFVSTDAAGRSTLQAWSEKGNRVRTILHYDGLLGAGSGSDRFNSIGCQAIDNQAICVTAAAAQPPQVESINLDTGRRRTLFDPNQRLRAKHYAVTEYITWKDQWGRAATGVLLLPTSTRKKAPLPLVITSYRCSGFLRGGVGADVPEHLLAQAGFVTLCTNFDLGKAFGPYPDNSIEPGQYANLQTTLDIWEAAIQMLGRRGLIDTQRVGVSGLSFGAEATLHAISHSKSFAAASAGGPPFMDPFNFYIFATKGELAQAHFKTRNMPDPDDDKTRFYERVSPALRVEQITAPVLIQASENEFRAGIQFYANMQRHCRPLEVVVFPEEGHNRMQPRHRLATNERNIDWFNFWLNSKVDPQPRKAEQYSRWEHLRQLQQDLRKASETDPEQ